MRLAIFLLCAAFGAATSARTVPIATTCAELRAFARRPPVTNLTLRLRGTLTCDKSPTVPVLALEDNTGAIVLRCNDNPPFKSGTRVDVTLSVSPSGILSTGASAVRATDRIAVSTLPVIGGSDFASGIYDCRPVSLDGVLREAFRDELDENYVYFVLNADGVNVPGAFQSKNAGDLSALRARIGRRIRVTGLCDALESGLRYHAGTLLLVSGPDDIRSLEEVEGDPFAVPSVTELARMRAADIAARGRHRADGRVLAVWGTRRFLLRTAADALTVETAGDRLPACGDMVTVVGFPVSDLFHVNLIGARWRPSDLRLPPEAEPAPVTSEVLTEDTGRRRSINALLHGRPVRLAGRSTRTDDGAALLVTDAHGSFRVLPGPDGLADVADGSQVAVTGVCLLDAERWSPENVFPRARGIVVVARSPGGIAVTARPGWWTNTPLVAVLATLLALILASVSLNVILRRIVRRRERELEGEIVARVESDLKLHERTRLAVELHDTVSQNLTGVALELRAARRAAAERPEDAAARLALAQRTLDGCRDELRNCLWDLRHSALEETDFNEAIRTTLAPHLGDAELTVRFAVPRDRFTDKTAHAILSILRELAVNAVRHGGAHRLRVAGGIDGNVLKFSLREDGHGFVPADAPGIEEGHFGLQGVRERAEALGGTFEIASAPGKGSRAVVSIVLPQEETP